MEARKFAIGDQVRLLLDSYADDSRSDVYTVSRLLPATANTWQYRAKRVGDSLERAVGEHQLAKVALQAWTNRPIAEAQQEMQKLRNARASARTRVMARRSEHERP